MSWSCGTTISGFENSDYGIGKATESIDALVPTGQDYAKVERDEQCEAAKRAAIQLIQAGGYNNAEEITVNLSGHANEDHAAKSGTANDAISVSVFVKKYKEPV